MDNIILRNKEGGSVGIIYSNEIDSFMEIPPVNIYDTRRHMEVRLRYSSRLWGLLMNSYSLTDNSNPLLDAVIDRFDVEPGVPFIVVRYHIEEVKSVDRVSKEV